MPLITRELNVIARCGMQFRGRALKGTDLTPAQSPYLLHICHRPGMSQEELAKALHVDRSNAARQLAHLESAGYVLREPLAEDRRVLAVHPTPKARGMVARLRTINTQWHDYLTQDMTPGEREQLEDLMEKMRRRAILWEQEGRE